jgi:SAM-dependent methyltransferase
VSVVDRAKAYDRHTGRYATELAAAFARFAGVVPGMRALDVGCGPGALARELAGTLGASMVAAVDPSEEYVVACRERVPGADVRIGRAEELPFEERSFGAVLAQLVVQVLDEPPRAAREMLRVTAPGGVVAACVWDFAGGMPLLDAYWGAAKDVDPDAAGRAGADERDPWCTPEGLRQLWESAGIGQVALGALSASARYDDFADALWSFTASASPSGAFYRSLGQAPRAALQEQFRARLGSPEGPFELTARAWAVGGRAAVG